MEARVFAQMARSLALHNADSILGRITCPTLVIASGRDTFTPGWIVEDMARAITDCDFLMIDDGTHAAPIEHPDLINFRVDAFLRDRVLQS